MQTFPHFGSARRRGSGFRRAGLRAAMRSPGTLGPRILASIGLRVWYPVHGFWTAPVKGTGGDKGFGPDRRTVWPPGPAVLEDRN